MCDVTHGHSYIDRSVRFCPCRNLSEENERKARRKLTVPTWLLYDIYTRNVKQTASGRSVRCRNVWSLTVTLRRIKMQIDWRLKIQYTHIYCFLCIQQRRLARAKTQDSPYGGGLQYLHRSPASRRRRRNGNPVPGGITGPPCFWEK
jgi:hypothetical protein